MIFQAAMLQVHLSTDFRCAQCFEFVTGVQREQPFGRWFLKHPCSVLKYAPEMQGRGLCP